MNLLLDLPDGVVTGIWDSLVADDPRALLRLEASSKAVWQRVQSKALDCRLTISAQQLLALDSDLNTHMLEVAKDVKQAGIVGRPEYKSMETAVSLCQHLVARKQELRLGLLERYGHALDPQVLARCKLLESQRQACPSPTMLEAQKWLREVDGMLILQSLMLKARPPSLGGP